MSILQCHNLDISIAGKAVCNGLNLQIEAGQIWGILGRNGVGKTTLLHTLAGLRQPDNGSITLHNTPLHSLSRKHIAQRLGLLLQQSEDAFPSTVMELVLSGRHPHIDTWSWENEEDINIAQRAIQTVGMTELSQRSVEQLSGGEKQRAAIARLLAQAPEIYLLDEPNSHLDLKYQMQLLGHFSQLSRTHNAAVLMSLHDVNLAQYYCSHVILISGNGICQYGTVDSLLNAENLSELYEHRLLEITGTDGALFLPEKK